MVKIYHSDMETNQLKVVSKIERGCWISMINPSEQEIKEVCKKTKIAEDFIKYSLDYEEKARIDQEEDDGTILFIVDVPIIEKEKDTESYTTMPLGMIVVRDDYFITVSLKKNLVIDNFEKKKNKGIYHLQKKQIPIPNHVLQCFLIPKLFKTN